MDVHGLIPSRDWEFFSWTPYLYQLWDPPSLLSNGYWGLKRPGHEDDHSPPSSAEIKECVQLYTIQYFFMAWCLVKQRDNFTFTFKENLNSIVK
jgi:hypothetical protein